MALELDILKQEGQKMKKIIFITVFFLLFAGFSALAQQEEATVEIGDIANLSGERDNHLIGYGLVVGLDGTGDSTRSQGTMQSIANMLKSFGVEVASERITARNAAAVMVTATLPPFTYPGDTIDVTVSSLGDARSLESGVLLMTPLRAGNEVVYAVAQGPVSTGGRDDNSLNRRTDPENVGQIPNGALVEREVDFKWREEDSFTLQVRGGSFANASRIAATINEHIPPEDDTDVASAMDPGRVEVRIPQYASDDVVNFVATIKSLEVEVEMPTRVVINERTGTVVIGHNVRISTVAIAHRGLKVQVGPDPEVEVDTGEDNEVFASLFGDHPDAVDDAYEEEAMMLMESGPTILDLVEALNAIGAEADDIIAILQAMKRAGALHAILEIM